MFIGRRGGASRYRTFLSTPGNERNFRASRLIKFDELPFDSIFFFSSLQNLLGLTSIFCLFVSLRLLLILFCTIKKRKKNDLRFNIMCQDFTQFYPLL